MRIYIGRDAQGKKEYKGQRVTGTKKDAEKVLTALLQKRDTGELLFTPSTQTVKDYCNEWLETVAKPRLAVSTFKNYTHYLEHKIYPKLGKLKLARLESKEIQKVYNTMTERGLSPRTVRYAHTVFSSALKHAVGQRYIPSNPCTFVQLPKQVHTEMNAMNEVERAAFIAASKQNRFHVYFMLLLATGLRPSEGLALKWKDVDPVNKTLQIVRTLEFDAGKPIFKEPKTKRSRRNINLHDQTVKLLLDYKPDGALGEDLIFTSQLGTPLDTSNMLNRYYKPCLLVAGLAHEEEAKRGTKIVSKFRLYDLRHTHATMLLAASVNPKIVSERLGHASIAITLDTYSHVLPTIQEAAVDAIGAALYQEEKEAETDTLQLNNQNN